MYCKANKISFVKKFNGHYNPPPNRNIKKYMHPVYSKNTTPL